MAAAPLGSLSKEEHELRRRVTAPSGKLYLCAVKDVYSNRIVGYSISDRMKAQLAVAALDNAVGRRDDVAGCILHSDRAACDP
jgi:transposase InsO family protein